MPRRTNLRSTNGADVTNTGGDLDCLCLGCKKTIGEKEDSMMCERCSGWVCFVCTGLSKPVYDEMSKNKSLHYFCHECQAPAMKAWKMDAKIEEICNDYFKKHEERLLKIEESVKTKADKTELDNTRSKIDTLEDQIKGLNHDISTLNHRINLVRFEPIEKNKRRNNIVIRGLPELQQSDNENENQDKKLTEVLLNEIGCGNITTTSITRLGKKVPNTDSTENRMLARPLRVCLSSADDKNKILKCGKKIRNSSTELFDPKKIFVIPDQTALEREDDIALRKQLQAKRDHFPDKTFIIRSRQIIEINPTTRDTLYL